MGDVKFSNTSDRRGSSDQVEIEPRVPDKVREAFWYVTYGRRHWGLVLMVILVAVGGWLASMTSGLTVLKNTTDLLVNRKIRRSIGDLRDQYRLIINDQVQVSASSFAGVEKDVNDILKLDPSNGIALYYSGEIQRATDPQSLFTSKGCIIPEKLAAYGGTLDVYQNAFLRYIDIERAVKDKGLPDDFSSEACYPPKNTFGYCAQRTAWINHLLANDLYAEVVSLKEDRPTKLDKLQRALEYSRAALKYRDENKNPGFLQCTPTTALMSKIQEAQVNP
jgi:hypothetical protein